MDGKHIFQVALIAAVTVAIAMRVDAIRALVAPQIGPVPTPPGR